MESAQDKAEREILVHKLLTGTATQQERDTALATMMLSLWTYADLKSYFLEMHKEQCARCPARIQNQPQNGDGGVLSSVKDIARTWGWVLLGLVLIIAKLTGTAVPMIGG